MLQGQPKGLYALALANTGERFGYYTMLAIFTLFLQAKFGYTAAETSTIFASFLAFVYFMPLIGGMMADKFGYGKMVTSGIIIMFVGYLLLAIPTDAASGKIMMFGSLALIACGTGLFKGNLQVMVGNLYDAPEYRSKRDQAFSLFYMAINIGAMYAPTAATKMTDWMLNTVSTLTDEQIQDMLRSGTRSPILKRNHLRREQRGTRRSAKRTRFHRRYGYVLFHVYREVVRGIQLWIWCGLYLIDHIDGYLYGIPLYL